MIQFLRTVVGLPLLATFGFAAQLERSEELLQIDNGVVKVGIDRKKGASITWLSWAGYPKNMVNSADPGRLIQQSYYAGRSLNRQADGQSKSWSPWTWNPIQGGGIGSWARVNEFKRIGDDTLFGETVPKLWDMPDEEAAAIMRQWTGFESGMSKSYLDSLTDADMAAIVGDPRYALDITAPQKQLRDGLTGQPSPPTKDTTPAAVRHWTATAGMT